MSGVLALLLGSLAVGVNGHRVLLWLGDRRVHPAILLTGWSLASVGLVASIVAMGGMLALPADQHPATGILRLAGGCWTALSSGTAPGWGQLLAALSVVTSATLLARLAWAVWRRLRQRRRSAPYLGQLRRLAPAGARGGDPLWIDDSRPLALSIAGRPGVIIMTEELRRQLSTDALQATLEHERAHLRGRHHALLAVADTLATAFPFCPLLRAARQATKDLVELAADEQAASRCGSAAVQEALTRLTGQPAPHVGLAMAGQLTEVRLRRLTTGHLGTSRPLRWIGCVGVAFSALLLPVATGWLALNLVGCVVA